MKQTTPKPIFTAFDFTSVSKSRKLLMGRKDQGKELIVLYYSFAWKNSTSQNILWINPPKIKH